MNRSAIATLLFLLVFAGPAPLVADQTDDRLDDLFLQLRSTDDRETGQRVTREIWRIWRHIDDADAYALMGKGVLDMAHRRYKGALRTFNELVQLAPGFAEGWNRRATLLYLMGDYRGSVDDIQRTLALEPRHFGALAGLGLIYMQLDEPQAAEAAFERALQVNPHLPGATGNLERLRQQIRDRVI
jgi:tetratricopeptide (TPR) repeat protein